MSKLIKTTHITASLILTLVVAAVLATIHWQFNQINYWQHFQLSGVVDKYFCEKACMSCLVREPINTWTNLPFLFFFFIILLTAIRDWRFYSRVNMLTYLPVYSFLYAFGSLYMFTGSGFFHLSLTARGEQMDLSAVFFLALLPFIYNLHKVYNMHRYGNPVRTTRRSLLIFITLFAILFALLTAFKWQLETLLIVPVLFLFTALAILHMEWKHPGTTDLRHLITAAIFMLMGIVAFVLDRLKVWCEPESWLQFHPLWHICCAISFFYLYLYLRSERVFSIYQFRIR